MKYIITLIIFYIGIVLGSCNADNSKQLNDDITKCMKERMSMESESMGIATIDLYGLYIDFENILLKKKILSNSSKEDYLLLFKRLSSDTCSIKYKELYNDLIIDDHFFYLDYPNIHTASVRCNWFIIEKNKLENDNYTEYYNALIFFDKTGDYDNWQVNLKLLESTPNNQFSNIIYRAPLLSILYIHILGVANPPRTMPSNVHE